MVEIALDINKNNKVIESKDLTQIEHAFNKLLYIPEDILKPRIIEEIIKYLNTNLREETYPLKIFITQKSNEITGIVIAQIHPDYRSYGRKCGSFGWLSCLDIDSCEVLMNSCEKFMKENKIRRLRGPINYPKLVGGIGYQIDGFERCMLTGVSYNNTNLREVAFLKQLGYKLESHYWSVEVLSDYWKKGRTIPKRLLVKFPTINELKSFKSEILKLANSSFNAIMADATGGSERLDEMISLFEQTQKLYNHNIDKINEIVISKLSNNSAFLKLLQNQDFSKNLPWVTLIFTKETHILVGAGFLLPNIFQHWKEEDITEANGDTVMIHPEFVGKGIFSLGQNIGRVALKLVGINYIEGTQLWANNEHAVEVMFPHCKPVRKHVVLQKDNFFKN
ncbi:MAG: hypothetical protein GF311_07375 [Candidatus Lokiarchaeota archaeon]|nr:hypothetical protein [Candidatus Lokiarchaeota archaeon]